TIAFAHSAQNVVVADFVAAANTAIAQNACIVIDRNGYRRIVTSPGSGATRETRILDAFGPRHTFELAIAGLLLPRARRGVIGHQKLDERAARVADFFGSRRNNHAAFHRTHTRSSQHAPAYIHHANAADTDGNFILLMAERRDANVVQPRGVE